MSRIVVIGAGQAGAALVAKLRNLDDQCSIDLVGKEDVLPYQRPPLSKKISFGGDAFGAPLFAPRKFLHR